MLNELSLQLSIFFLCFKRDKGGNFAFERSWCPLQSAWSILIAENVMKEPSKASSHSESTNTRS